MSASSWILPPSMSLVRTHSCLITSRISSSSLATLMMLGLRTTCLAKSMISSEKVALKSRDWQDGGMRRWMAIDLSRCPPSFTISSASSRTKTLMVRGLRPPLRSQSSILPGVPTTRCASQRCPRGIMTPATASCVVRSVMCCDMGLTQNCRICEASSRVGATHRAWQQRWLVSIRFSIPRQNAAVFPLPLCACPIRFWGGLARIMGRATSWICDGRSNPMVYTPFSSTSGMFSSLKVLAENRCEFGSLWITRMCFLRSLGSVTATLRNQSSSSATPPPLGWSPGAGAGAPPGGAEAEGGAAPAPAATAAAATAGGAPVLSSDSRSPHPSPPARAATGDFLPPVTALLAVLSWPFTPV
mmetsp:Transcript_15975/g.23507  ORF Transcript_15975/g.23507 Transcript_15975/m.23507 type:complete len:358 (-) Transcript_15975:276-1349(-)